MDNKTNDIDAHQSLTSFNIKFENGKFLDLDTNVFMNFKNGSSMIVTTAASNILDLSSTDIDAEGITEIYPEGTELYFKMLHNSGLINFAVKLDSPLQMLKKNNKMAKLQGGACTVFEMIVDCVVIQLNFCVPSLNQAYIQMSMKFRPNNRLHHCNVYDTFYSKDGIYLNSLRY